MEGRVHQSTRGGWGTVLPGGLSRDISPEEKEARVSLSQGLPRMLSLQMKLQEFINRGLQLILRNKAGSEGVVL